MSRELLVVLGVAAIAGGFYWFVIRPQRAAAMQQQQQQNMPPLAQQRPVTRQVPPFPLPTPAVQQVLASANSMVPLMAGGAAGVVMGLGQEFMTHPQQALKDTGHVISATVGTVVHDVKAVGSAVKSVGGAAVHGVKKLLSWL